MGYNAYKGRTDLLAYNHDLDEREPIMNMIRMIRKLSIIKDWAGDFHMYRIPHDSTIGFQYTYVKNQMGII